MLDTERWIGITATRSTISIAGLEYSQADEKPTVFLDENLTVPNNDTPGDYGFVFGWIMDIIEQNKVTHIVIKAGSLGAQKATMAMLNSSEVRGVVICAAAKTNKIVQICNPASLSRNFGTRKTDAYIKDSEFWASEVNGKLRATAKDPAMMILAAKKK